jgi:hypothetical protein
LPRAASQDDLPRAEIARLSQFACAREGARVVSDSPGSLRRNFPKRLRLFDRRR